MVGDNRLAKLVSQQEQRQSYCCFLLTSGMISGVLTPFFSEHTLEGDRENASWECLYYCEVAG